MKQFLFLSALAALLLLINLLFLNFPGSTQKKINPLFSQEVGNPAVQNCLNQGGQRLIRRDSAGNNLGYCLLPDGSLCEEWTFYQGNCVQTSQNEN